MKTEFVVIIDFFPDFGAFRSVRQDRFARPQR